MPCRLGALGLIALLLAFGLTMAVGRYESRRSAVELEANAIGTTYLRARTLAELMRSESLGLLKRYGGACIALSRSVPDSAQFRAASATSVVIQSKLWASSPTTINRSRPRWPRLNSTSWLHRRGLSSCGDTPPVQAAGL
jgi:hypothetical protein